VSRFGSYLLQGTFTCLPSCPGLAYFPPCIASWSRLVIHIPSLERCHSTVASVSVRVMNSTLFGRLHHFVHRTYTVSITIGCMSMVLEAAACFFVAFLRPLEHILVNQKTLVHRIIKENDRMVSTNASGPSASKLSPIGPEGSSSDVVLASFVSDESAPFLRLAKTHW